MIFKPGTYFVGDLGFVLGLDDLRMLFSEINKHNGIENGCGLRNIVETDFIGSKPEKYWVANTPTRSGTFYDQYGKTWGFDWGVFGCIEFKWIVTKANYDENKVIFNEPFNCVVDKDVIKIGHLIFSTNQ